MKNKGDISTKDVTVTFNAFVVDGKIPNKIALAYMRSMVNTGSFKTGKINTNSYEMDWSISGINGEKTTASALNLMKSDRGYEFTTADKKTDYKEKTFVNISDGIKGTDYSTYDPFTPSKS